MARRYGENRLCYFFAVANKIPQIVDESDIFIDVHKAIRRLNPSPMLHFTHGYSTASGGQRRSISAHYVSRHQDPTQLANTVTEIAHSATEDGVTNIIIPEDSVIERGGAATPQSANPSTEEREIPGIAQRGRRLSAKQPPPGLEEALSHLAPANLANRPRETTSKTVKIKGAHSTITNVPSVISSNPPVAPGNLVIKDYGTVGTGLNGNAVSDENEPATTYADVVKDGAAENGGSKGTFSGDVTAATAAKRLQKRSERKGKKARSGSLVERVENRKGVRKTVIETTSSSESDDEVSGGEDAQGSGERSPLLSSSLKPGRG